MADLGSAVETFGKSFLSNFDPTSAAKTQNQNLNTQFRFQSLMLQREAAKRAIKTGERDEARLQLEKLRFQSKQVSDIFAGFDQIIKIGEISPGKAALVGEAIFRARGIPITKENKQLITFLSKVNTPEELAAARNMLTPIVKALGGNPEILLNEELIKGGMSDLPKFMSDTLPKMIEAMGEAKLRERIAPLITEAINEIIGAPPLEEDAPSPDIHRGTGQVPTFGETPKQAEQNAETFKQSMVPVAQDFLVGASEEDTVQFQRVVRGLSVNQSRESFNDNFDKAMNFAKAMNLAGKTAMAKALISEANARRAAFEDDPKQIQAKLRAEQKIKNEFAVKQAQEIHEAEQTQETVNRPISRLTAQALGRPDLFKKRMSIGDISDQMDLNADLSPAMAKELLESQVSVKGMLRSFSQTLRILKRSPESVGLPGGIAKLAVTIESVFNRGLKVLSKISPHASEFLTKQAKDDDFRAELAQQLSSVTGIAADSARIKSLGVNLMFLVGAAHGQNMRSMSDKDREAFAEMIGISLGTPELMEATMRLVANKLTDEFQTRYITFTNQPFPFTKDLSFNMDPQTFSDAQLGFMANVALNKFNRPGYTDETTGILMTRQQKEAILGEMKRRQGAN